MNLSSILGVEDGGVCICEKQTRARPVIQAHNRNVGSSIEVDLAVVDEISQGDVIVVEDKKTPCASESSL